MQPCAPNLELGFAKGLDSIRLPPKMFWEHVMLIELSKFHVLCFERCCATDVSY